MTQDIDPTDIQILNALQENAHLTNKELAMRLNLTVTPVYERIKRLEREGFIERYVALVNKEKVHRNLMAFCNISLHDQSKPSMEAFEAAVSVIQEVVECYHVAGQYDYMLKVLVKDMPAYQHFIKEKLGLIANIAHAQSWFVLSEVLHTTHVPIP